MYESTFLELFSDYELELLLFVAGGYFFGSSIAGELGQVLGVFIGVWLTYLGK